MEEPCSLFPEVEARAAARVLSTASTGSRAAEVGRAGLAAKWDLTVRFFNGSAPSPR
jgi:hypothetical protein